jgi:predicted enzyme related to lactoylglutathione lyase
MRQLKRRHNIKKQKDKMNRLILTISIAIIFISCNQASKINKKINKMDKQKNEATNTASTKDTTPKVTGIGGIFFYSDNLKETKEWYTKNLGIEINDWGSSSFESRNVNRPDEINSLQWKPFKKGDEYFSPSKKYFMINYQVQNIEGLVNKLKENGVTILDSIATYDFGKFVHIMDTEGNKIELWEPIDADQNGGKTTK